MKQQTKLDMVSALEAVLATIKTLPTEEATEIYSKLKQVNAPTKFTWSHSDMYGPDLSELKAAFPYYPDPENPDEMDAFWHGTTAKSGRSLNHCMNRMNKDWELNSVRTPKGWRALTEVAADNSISIDALVWAMLDHPRFGKEGSLFHKAATAYLTK